MVGNITLWPAKTFERRGVTRDLRKGGPIEMLRTYTIAKLIKIKVLWHQLSNLMFNLHYMCLFYANFSIKNIQINFIVNN